MISFLVQCRCEMRVVADPHEWNEMSVEEQEEFLEENMDLSQHTISTNIIQIGDIK